MIFLKQVKAITCKECRKRTNKSSFVKNFLQSWKQCASFFNNAVFSAGSPRMETRIVELEKDPGEDQFQQELNRWFESRGIIANLRSHLRHLMIMALQNTQFGLKSAGKSSPKAQAISLMIAEYLFMHKCHYTLSVFTSEVPNLVSFHPDVVFQGGKSCDAARKGPKEKCFQENQVEEIFNALGMSSHEEELTHLKTRYLDKSNDSSLVELFLQTVVEMSTKLLILQNLKSNEVNGERLLSKEWSSRIVDILLSEKIASPQITALEEAIFRITENEMRKIVENERKLQIRLLSEREKRIQEYLQRYKDEILLRLIEAEKDLTMRKDMIIEELSEREKRLTKMVMEWKNKHEEILKLSKDFHNIESENKILQKKLKALEEENVNLKTHRKTQNKTTEDLQEEMNLLKNKLKETVDSNAILSKEIQMLMSKDNKEVFICHDNANQKAVITNSDEIPLIWSENMTSDYDVDLFNRHNQESDPKFKCKEFIEKNPILQHPDQWNTTEPIKTHFTSTDREPSKAISYVCSSEDGNVSLSSSSEEIILSVRKRLQDLEEETNRINRNYLEYKLKCVSIESDSESSKNLSNKSPPTIHDEAITKETKFCQTNKEDPFIIVQKPKELEKKKTEFFELVTKKSEEVSPTKPLMRIPTKRQLQHRDYFLKSRQLLRTLQKQDLEDFHTDPSVIDSYASGSGEESIGGSKKYNKKSPMKSPLENTSIHSSKIFEIENEPSAESVKKILAESSNDTINGGIDCLALLEETRIKSPQISVKVRLTGSEKEETEKKEKGDDDNDKRIKTETCSESIVVSPESGKVFADKKVKAVVFCDKSY